MEAYIMLKYIKHVLFIITVSCSLIFAPIRAENVGVMPSFATAALDVLKSIGSTVYAYKGYLLVSCVCFAAGAASMYGHFRKQDEKRIKDRATQDQTQKADHDAYILRRTAELLDYEREDEEEENQHKARITKLKQEETELKDSIEALKTQKEEYGEYKRVNIANIKASYERKIKELEELMQRQGDLSVHITALQEKLDQLKQKKARRVSREKPKVQQIVPK